MKLNKRLFAIAALAVASGSASGAYVVTYAYSQYSPPVPTPSDYGIPAYDYVDDLAVSTLAGKGGVRYDSPVAATGYDTAFNVDKYVGFTITVDTGHQLNLTDLAFNGYASGLAAFRMTAFRWGYRIDADNDGVFEQDWVYGQTFQSGVSGYTNGSEKVWDFDDFTTTGTVEFGLFAQTPAANPEALLHVINSASQLSLNGTVSAVPEPSAVFLGMLGGLALLRRRR